MALIKRYLLLACAAALIFWMNGAVNAYLLQPAGELSPLIDGLRYRLDEAVFVAAFFLIGILFLGMYAVLSGEKGYLYFSLFCMLSSLMLFAEWDEKSLLFGPFPEWSYSPLLIKSGLAALLLSIIGVLLGGRSSRLLGGLRAANLLLFALIACCALAALEGAVLALLNQAFLVLAVSSLLISTVQIILYVRTHKADEELNRVVFGLLLFTVILLPDLAKDLIQDVFGVQIGYGRGVWQQSLEDTYAWALLALVAVLGSSFFRRFLHTLRDNQTVTEQLRLRNQALALEIQTRVHMDELLSELSRAGRRAELEQIALRAGQRYLGARPFGLLRLNRATAHVEALGHPLPAAARQELAAALRDRPGFAAGELLRLPGAVLCAAEAAGDEALLLAVYEDEAAAPLTERECYALRLMGKYVAFFYEYYHAIEDKLSELEHSRRDRRPWASKLFMELAEKERKRLASDLHDEVLQEILHIRRLLDARADEAADRLEMEPDNRGGQQRSRTAEQVDNALENVVFMLRETCQELMPSTITENGLAYAIAKLVEKTRLRADFRLEVHVEPVLETMSAEQALTVYRIVQELITNAVKHSGAVRVRLEITVQGGRELRLRYEDDGCGLRWSEEREQPQQLGLRGMIERTRMLGGDAVLDSQPGQGLQVMCMLPL